MKKNSVASKTSEVAVKRSWLFSGYQREQKIELYFEKFGFSNFIDLVLNEVIPTEVFLKQDLLNISGNQAGELLSLSGKISEGNLLEVSINAVFKEFQGGTKAVYAAKESRVGILSGEIPSKDLGKIFPFYPNDLRCALQFYTPTWIGASLGMAPRLNSSLLISANSERALINLKSLSVKNKDSFCESELGEFAELFEKLN